MGRAGLGERAGVHLHHGLQRGQALAHSGAGLYQGGALAMPIGRQVGCFGRLAQGPGAVGGGCHDVPLPRLHGHFHAVT